MRTCPQCQTGMLENATLHADGGLYLRGGTGSFGIFDKYPLMAAVCPNCGEVSTYIEEFREFAEKSAKKEEYFF